MQINLGQIINGNLSTEQRLGSELMAMMKAYGLTGSGMENLGLMDIFGAPGHSSVGTSALRDVETLRGWNFTAVMSKSLQFSLGNMSCYIPKWMAEAIAEKYGEEYKAAKRVTGLEQYNVPEDWVAAPRQHRIAKLLAEPNPFTDQATFFLQIAFQTDIHGVAFVLVLPNAAGLPKEMWLIPKSGIQPIAPSTRFPEGSYRTGHLSKLSINTYDEDSEPKSLQEMLGRLSNREFSAKYIIPLGVTSPVFLDDFLNPSSALSDTLDTDAVLHRARRAAMEKIQTIGPRMEPMPGVTIANNEWTKIMEEFEAQNMGPNNYGNSWRAPHGVKVTDDSKSGREMEFVNSADQSRDHTLGQRLTSAAMMGLGDGGSYAQVIGLIKGQARMVLQPLMRIYSGQLRLGLRRFFEEPQTEFMTIMQCANIDDHEQKMKEWGFLKESGAVKVIEVRDAFNMMPFGDENDDKIAGSQEQPGGMNPFGGNPEDEYAPEYGGDPQVDSGEPETPGVGNPETDSALKTASVQSQTVSSTMGRREFMRHSKNIMDIVTKFKDGVFGEKTARLMLQTLGLPTDSAQEFIDSVKEEPKAEAPMSTLENQTTASALFSRMASIRNGSFKSLIDDQAQTAATHPENHLKQPTDKQAKSGLYRKGKVRLCGMQIEVENPVGSIRSGVRPDGSRWAVEMQDHYGYIVGAVGFDKDQLDIFIKQGTEPTFDGSVYVINQANEDGSFDEHKCFIGCESKLDAIKRYLDNYDDDWADRILSVAKLTIPQFKDWMLDADGPLSGELTPEDCLRYMSIGTGGNVAEQMMVKSADTSSVFEKGISLSTLRDAATRYNKDDYSPEETTEDDPQEKAELIADILTSIYGDDAESLISDGDDAEKLASAFGKAFGSAGMFKEARTVRRGANRAGRDPRDADGDGRIFDGTPLERAAGQQNQEQPARRSRARNTPERIAEIHSQVEAALKGERTPKSAKALADSLSSLTVKQLHELKTKYQMKASGRTKTELVAKLAKRLDYGRRKDDSAMTVSDRSDSAVQISQEARNRSREAVASGDKEQMRQSRSVLSEAAAENRDVAERYRRTGQTSVADIHDALATELGNRDATVVEAKRHQAGIAERQQAARSLANQSSQRANAAQEALNTIADDRSDKLSSAAQNVANMHTLAARHHTEAGNSEAADLHTRHAANAASLSEAAASRHAELQASQRVTLQQREAEIERDVLWHLKSNPNQTMRDLATITQVEPGSGDDPLQSPLNRTLRRMVDNGQIVARDRQFGGPLFSLPERPQTAQTQSPEVQQRLDALRANLPGKFVIANDENGNALLVTPNDRTRKLSTDPSQQVTQIEEQLRRRGFNPDDIVAGGSKPQRRDKPAPVEKPVQTEQAAPVEQPAASEQQTPPARVSRAMTSQQRTALKKIGAEFLDDLTPDATGSLILAQPESKGRVVITEGQLPNTWAEVPAESQIAIKTAFREEARKKLKKDSYWKYSIRDQAKAQAQSVVDSTMPNASPLERATAITEQAAKLMNGRSSWFKQQAKAELDRRVSTQTEDQLHRWASSNQMLSSVSAPVTEAALASFGLKKQDLASVIGLPDDWTVTAKGYTQTDGSYKLHLSVNHSMARMQRYITMQDGKPHLYNSSFFANDRAPKGMGLDIFSKSVANAKRLGFGKIETMPCRSESMVGYAVWPQFGYDAPLSAIGSSTVEQNARQRYPQAQTIRDIYDTPGGQEWWWENGTSLNKATFTLNDDSRNMNALQTYMSKKKSARTKVRTGAGTAGAT